MQSGPWENRQLVIENLKRLGTRRGWRRKMRNEPLFPAIIWVMAQRPLINVHE
jgi:hypothetical protein